MSDAHPYKDAPREYGAFAMPAGDRRFGVPGPLIMVIERQAKCSDHRRYYSLAEATELHEQLGGAIETMKRARAMSEPEAGPVAASGPYPFRGHRTQAEIAEAAD